MPRKPFHVLLISCAMLVPCFWQSRIQAVDLSSHLYNAWLSTEIEAGRGGGLELAHPWTNVLVDRMLVALLRAGGPGLAEHVVMPLLVLILFWGAVAWIRAATGRVPWALMPCVAMLAYGWVFHMGFLNFYLSTGLAFWTLALLWRPSLWRACGGAVLLVLGFLSHPISTAWSVAVLGYVWMARRWPARLAAVLPAVALSVVMALWYYLTWHYDTRHASYQVLGMFAVDQVWVFGMKYVLTMSLLGLIWVSIAVRWARSGSNGPLWRNVSLQLCVVMSFAILVLPTRLDLPDYRVPLSYVMQRLTLPFGVLICVLLNQVEPLRWQRLSLAGVALLQFSFLYADTAALNRWEDRAGEAVAGLPRGARVISSLHDVHSRVSLWNHPVDRACIGHCYSYQNYEPGSLQFQVQARRPNRLVMHDAADARAVEQGNYVLRPSDLPVYELVACADGPRLCVRAGAAGDRIEPELLSILPAWW